MSLERQIKTEQLYVEYGHASKEDKAYENEKKTIDGRLQSVRQ